jgi:hypothetical protein
MGDGRSVISQSVSNDSADGILVPLLISRSDSHSDSHFDSHSGSHSDSHFDSHSDSNSESSELRISVFIMYSNLKKEDNLIIFVIETIFNSFKFINSQKLIKLFDYLISEMLLNNIHEYSIFSSNFTAMHSNQ